MGKCEEFYTNINGLRFKANLNNTNQKLGNNSTNNGHFFINKLLIPQYK